MQHTCRTPGDLQWVAEYDDGSQLLECDGETDHGFAEIDLARLVKFALIRRGDFGAQQPMYQVHQAPGTRVIFFRRHQQPFNVKLEGIELGEWVTLCCVGLKVSGKAADERAVKAYQFVLPDGSTVLTTDYQFSLL